MATEPNNDDLSLQSMERMVSDTAWYQPLIDLGFKVTMRTCGDGTVNAKPELQKSYAGAGLRAGIGGAFSVDICSKGRDAQVVWVFRGYKPVAELKCAQNQVFSLVSMIEQELNRPLSAASLEHRLRVLHHTWAAEPICALVRRLIDQPEAEDDDLAEAAPHPDPDRKLSPIKAGVGVRHRLVISDNPDEEHIKALADGGWIKCQPFPKGAKVKVIGAPAGSRYFGELGTVESSRFDSAWVKFDDESIRFPLERLELVQVRNESKLILVDALPMDVQEHLANLEEAVEIEEAAEIKPFLQPNDYTCGASVIHMLNQALGDATKSFEDVSKMAHTSRYWGTLPMFLSSTLNKLGIHHRKLKVTAANLAECLRTGMCAVMVVYLEEKVPHWILVTKWDGTQYHVNDPAAGAVTFTPEQMSQMLNPASLKTLFRPVSFMVGTGFCIECLNESTDPDAFDLLGYAANTVNPDQAFDRLGLRRIVVPRSHDLIKVGWELRTDKAMYYVYSMNDDASAPYGCQLYLPLWNGHERYMCLSPGHIRDAENVQGAVKTIKEWQAEVANGLVDEFQAYLDDPETIPHGPHRQESVDVDDPESFLRHYKETPHAVKEYTTVATREEAEAGARADYAAATGKLIEARYVSVLIGEDSTAVEGPFMVRVLPGALDEAIVNWSGGYRDLNPIWDVIVNSGPPEGMAAIKQGVASWTYGPGYHISRRNMPESAEALDVDDPELFLKGYKKTWYKVMGALKSRKRALDAMDGVFYTTSQTLSGAEDYARRRNLMSERQMRVWIIEYATSEHDTAVSPSTAPTGRVWDLTKDYQLILRTPGATAQTESVEPTKAEITAAAQVAEPPASPEQAEAGNYQKGHLRLYGLDITVENAKGQERSGVDKGGKRWSVEMSAHYGYIKGTVGKDGDHVDVYIGEDPESDTVWVVDQLDADSGEFDEHKCLLAFSSKAEAEKTYLAGFSDGKGKERLGAMTEMTVAEFKEWAHSEETDEPLAESADPDDVDLEAYAKSTLGGAHLLEPYGLRTENNVTWWWQTPDKSGLILATPHPPQSVKPYRTGDPIVSRKTTKYGEVEIEAYAVKGQGNGDAIQGLQAVIRDRTELPSYLAKLKQQVSDPEWQRTAWKRYESVQEPVDPDDPSHYLQSANRPFGWIHDPVNFKYEITFNGKPVDWMGNESSAVHMADALNNLWRDDPSWTEGSFESPSDWYWRVKWGRMPGDSVLLRRSSRRRRQVESADPDEFDLDAYVRSMSESAEAGEEDTDMASFNQYTDAVYDLEAIYEQFGYTSFGSNQLGNAESYYRVTKHFPLPRPGLVSADDSKCTISHVYARCRTNEPENITLGIVVKSQKDQLERHISVCGIFLDEALINTAGGTRIVPSVRRALLRIDAAMRQIPGFDSWHKLSSWLVDVSRKVEIDVNRMAENPLGESAAKAVVEAKLREADEELDLGSYVATTFDIEAELRQHGFEPGKHYSSYSKEMLKVYTLPQAYGAGTASYDKMEISIIIDTKEAAAWRLTLVCISFISREHPYAKLEVAKAALLPTRLGRKAGPAVTIRRFLGRLPNMVQSINWPKAPLLFRATAEVQQALYALDRSLDESEDLDDPEAYLNRVSDPAQVLTRLGYVPNEAKANDLAENAHRYIKVIELNPPLKTVYQLTVPRASISVVYKQNESGSHEPWRCVILVLAQFSDNHKIRLCAVSANFQNTIAITKAVENATETIERLLNAPVEGSDELYAMQERFMRNELLILRPPRRIESAEEEPEVDPEQWLNQNLSTLRTGLPSYIEPKNYDAVEVCGLELDGDDVVRTGLPKFYGVYLRHLNGEADHIVDFNTFAAATAYAAKLERDFGFRLVLLPERGVEEAEEPEVDPERWLNQNLPGMHQALPKHVDPAGVDTVEIHGLTADGTEQDDLAPVKYGVFVHLRTGGIDDATTDQNFNTLDSALEYARHLRETYGWNMAVYTR